MKFTYNVNIFLITEETICRFDVKRIFYYINVIIDHPADSRKEWMINIF